MKKGSGILVSSVISASVLFGGAVLTADRSVALAQEELQEVLEGWKYIGSGYEWNYYIAGVKQKNWIHSDGNWYFFDEDGRMKTGWLIDQGKQYYLLEDGKMATGWLFREGDWYYLHEDGAVAIGWLEDQGKKYYLLPDGRRASGWMTEEDKRYYLDGNGEVATGWLEDEGDTYYLHEDGTMVVGWLTVDDDKFYLNEDGMLATGWLEIEGERYFFAEDGKMQTEGSITDADGNTYTFSASGVASKVEPNTTVADVVAASAEEATPSGDVIIRVGMDVHINDLVNYGKALLGSPYQWGGVTRQGFDCSGFVQFAFREAIGKSLPRTSAEMYGVGSPVAKSELIVGDLVFFNTLGRGVSHVAIYIGGNQVIHSQSTEGVSISNLDCPYWSPRYIGAKRVL